MLQNNKQLHFDLKQICRNECILIPPNSVIKVVMQITDRFLKHFKVAAEKIALGRLFRWNSYLPTFSLTAARNGHPSRKTAYMIKNTEIQVGKEIYLFKPKVIFSAAVRSVRIRARHSKESVFMKCIITLCLEDRRIFTVYRGCIDRYLFDIVT